MSKSRGKIKPQPAAAIEPPSPPPRSPATIWGTVVAVYGILVYLAIFFRQELAAGAAELRASLFWYLPGPDVLAEGWVEGSWRNFSLLDRWPILLLAVVLLGIATLLGTVALWMSRASSNTTLLELYVLRIGVGLQLLSLVTLAGGLFGAGPGPIRFLVQLGLFAAVMWAMQWLVKRTRQELAEEQPLHPPGDSFRRTHLLVTTEWILTAGLVYLSLAILLGAMLPPWDFDVREYHLQVPKEWSQQGRVTFLPHNIYGNMPLGAELHAYAAGNLIPPSFTPRSWWWSALAGKLVSACYGPLTALLLYSAGRRFWSKLAGLSAAVMYLSNPWIIHVCVNGLNESALGFYLIAALYAALLGGSNRHYVGLAGFFAGAAASIKYTGVLFVVVPLGILMVWYATRALFLRGELRASQKLHWRPLAATFFLMAALSGGSWYAKNWIVAGNPTYPLLASIFGGKTLTPEKTARWNQAHRPPPFTSNNLADSTARIGWKDQFQSPLMIPLTVLGIIALACTVWRRRDTANPHTPLSTPHSIHVLTVTTLLLLFFFAAWWLFTHRLSRFLVPAIPLAALLAGGAVEFARPRPLRYIVGGLMAVGLSYNLLMAATPFVGDNRWFVSLERLRTDEPRTDEQISRVSAVHRWLNENVKPGEAVLCVGDAAVFDLEMPVYYNTCFDDCLLVNWTTGKTLEQRREELTSRRIAYVYFHEAEYKRYISKGNYGYDPRFSPKLLDELVAQDILSPPLPNAPPRIYAVVP